MFFWPLHPAVLHLFGAACFTCLSQAGGQSGKSVLASPESSLSFPWGSSQSRLMLAFLPVHL